MSGTTHRPVRPRALAAPVVLACVAVLLAAVPSQQAAAGPAAAASSPRSTPLTIDTTTGTWRGRASGATRQFLGIRYAKPPTGTRRWTLPRPASDTEKVRAARTAGPSCPQSADVALASASATDEDCLFLNVTTPRRASDEPWPVMVWWHGGGFTSGAGSQYDARRLAEQGDVAVVTVNYRLGMLGYLGLPGLQGAGNFGLADQLAALRWANDNAAAFGGDPDNVTVFGQSAGGTSVCAALTTPGAEKLIDKAIFSSGSCRLAWPKGTLFPGLPASRSLISARASNKLGQGVSAGLGCTSADPLPCLRRKPVDELVATSDAFGNPLAYGTELLPRDPAKAIERGRVADVPIISGGNQNEHRSFIGGLLLAQPDAVTAANYADLIATSFGDDAPDVARRYPLADYDSAPLAWSSLVTDVAWACTTTHGARDLAAATRGPGSKVYSYEFADPSAIDVSMVGSSGLTQAGAHATDLPFLFDLGGKNLLETRAQRRLGRTMVQLWTSFAHTGTPASTRAPRWRPTTATKAPVLQLTSPEVRAVDHRREHQCGFWDSLDLT